MRRMMRITSRTEFESCLRKTDDGPCGILAMRRLASCCNHIVLRQKHPPRSRKIIRAKGGGTQRPTLT